MKDTRPNNRTWCVKQTIKVWLSMQEFFLWDYCFVIFFRYRSLFLLFLC